MSSRAKTFLCFGHWNTAKGLGFSGLHSWGFVAKDRKGNTTYQCRKCFSFKKKRESWFVRNGIILRKVK